MLPSKEKISIIIPAYNDRSTIGIILKTLLNETRVNIEVIVINDGSKDNTLEVINSFSDVRLKVIDQHNQGLSAARNNGMKLATGDWVTFIDGDDNITDDFCYGRYLLTQSPVKPDLVISNYIYEDTNGNNKSTGINDKSFLEIKSIRNWRNNFIKNNTWHSTVWMQTIRTSIVKENNLTFPVGSLFEDVYWQLDLWELNPETKIIVTSNIDYLYKHNPNSITRSTKNLDKKCAEHYKILLDIKNRLRERPDLADIYLQCGAGVIKNMYNEFRNHKKLYKSYLIKDFDSSEFYEKLKQRKGRIKAMLIFHRLQMQR